MKPSQIPKTDLQYQEQILPKVSRTFALTIPQLPPELAQVVANAYLLCRLADTIEDDRALNSSAKTKFMGQFLEVLRRERDPVKFAAELIAELSDQSPAPERDLVAHAENVVRITHGFTSTQQQSLVRCVTTMCQGMPRFQRNKTLNGLETLEDLDQYCYYVAGVVGEMLTELFCEHSEEIAVHRQSMMPLAVSFGQGLQMTNILKDIWEDSGSDTCWLPRAMFPELDGGLAEAIARRDGAGLSEGIAELVGITHAHLIAALRYTCHIPKREVGIRRFCVWAIGLAILTLRKIHLNPGYTSGLQVKVSRRTVKATVLVSSATLYSNRALRSLFAMTARRLPPAQLPISRAPVEPHHARENPDRVDLHGTVGSGTH